MTVLQQNMYHSLNVVMKTFQKQPLYLNGAVSQSALVQLWKEKSPFHSHTEKKMAKLIRVVVQVMFREKIHSG